jgi:hypothetical protein
MAIVYGSLSTGGSNSFKVGYDWSGWSAVDSGSASVTGTISFYVFNTSAVSNDLQTFNFVFNGATVSGNTTNTYTNTSTAGTARLISTRTVTYNYSTWGSSPGNFGSSMQGLGSGSGTGGFYTGGPCSVTWDIPIPARPGGVPTSPSISASATGIRQITATWSASADPAVTRYDVYRNNDPGQLVSSSLATSFTDNERGNNESIYYVMYAYNAVGNSTGATSNTATTPMLPGQPGSLAANTSTFGTIVLTWTVSATTGGYGATYTILRNSTDIGLVTYGSGGPSYSFNDTTVAPYTTYNYVVLPTSNVGTGTGATISATSMGGVVNVRSSAGAWIKVVPQVRNSANTAWVIGQARARNNSTSEWKYGT